MMPNLRLWCHINLRIGQTIHYLLLLFVYISQCQLVATLFLMERFNGLELKAEEFNKNGVKDNKVV